MRGRDDRVEVAAFGRDVGVHQGVLVVALQLQAQRFDVLAVAGRLGQLLAVDEAHRAGGAHHCDLRAGPGDVDVAAHVLGAHDAVGAAVGLAGDHGDLGDGGLAVGVEQFGAAADDAVVLLLGSRQEAGNVHQHDDRHVEAVAGSDEPGGFFRGVDVQAAGELGRLVSDDADRAAVDPPEPDDDVLRVSGLHLEELVVVEDPGDHLVHVIRLVRRIRDQGVEFVVLLGEVVLDRTGVRRRGQARWFGVVVGRQVAQQVADVVEGVLLTGGDVVRGAGFGHVGLRAAEFLHGDVLTGDGFDDVGSGDEHLTGLGDHDDEVGERGGVDVAAGRRTHDQRDLRDHSGGQDVVAEDPAVEAEGDHALLDAGAGAVVDADQRPSGLDRQLLHLDDLLAVDLAEAAAEHCRVLAEDADVAAVDGAVAGDHAVADRPVVLQTEVRAAVAGQGVEFDERPFVEQGQDAFAGGQLALGVGLLDRALANRMQCLLGPLAQIGQLSGRRVDIRFGNARHGC